jgi:NAD(P)-dependent dehydrogenase (short-subunit alcohol dehydrogenase family)
VPIEAVSEEKFDALFRVNVRGTLVAVQKKALKLMSEGGSILMTGSIAGSKGFPWLSV